MPASQSSPTKLVSGNINKDSKSKITLEKLIEATQPILDDEQREREGKSLKRIKYSHIS
jgi:hypothetical protein